MIHASPRRKALVFAVLGAVAGSAQAIEFKTGDWSFTVSGNINAFYVTSNCDSGKTPVAAGLACTGQDTVAVRNGLLPGSIIFGAKTNQKGYDISANVGFYPGINSSAATGVNGAGNSSALATPGIDARQTYLTFGNASMGTIKMGRDIGLFGQDAILSDMTLLGVGSGGGSTAPGNTSLGRIGVGYIYTDFQPQITYTTPAGSPFSASVGLFQPLSSGDFTQDKQPGLQGKVDFKVGPGKVWAGLVSQKLKNPDNGRSFTGTGGELGAKFDAGPVGITAYGYSGKGVGTIGLFLLAADAAGNKRKSDGGYVQATIKAGDTKFGLSYGESRLKLTAEESNSAAARALAAKNKSGVLGVYHSLTPSLTLVGELLETKANAFNGNSNKESSVVLGAILFF